MTLRINYTQPIRLQKGLLEMHMLRIIEILVL